MLSVCEKKEKSFSLLGVGNKGNTELLKDSYIQKHDSFPPKEEKILLLVLLQWKMGGGNCARWPALLKDNYVLCTDLFLLSDSSH